MTSCRNVLLSVIALCFLAVSAIGQPLPPRCPGHITCQSGEGGGSNDDPIICHWPSQGKVPNKGIAFRWEPKEGATSYTLTVFDQNAAEKTKVTTSGTGVWLDLPNLGLRIGSNYVVLVRSDNDKSSNNHRFTLRNESEYKQTLLDLESDAQYRALDGVDKQLRKASFLHEKSWNLAASQAHNISTDNLMEMMKILDHFEVFRIALDPPQ